MDQYDDETERYLREFRPRAIRTLKVAPKARSILSRCVAAAVAAALLAGGLLWFAHREAARFQEAAKIPPPEVNVARGRRYESALALTKLALTDNEKLESLLTEESRKILPAVRGEQSTLKVLAKE